jgi:hypothetical protein
MQIAVKQTIMMDVRFLRASCDVPYWEDAEVDGVIDEQGDLIPCRNGNLWEPIIDFDTGVIVNWEQGKTASIHYKVCDAGVYTLLDGNMNPVKQIDGYVPKAMCPGDEGYGDYVIMEVDAAGRIADWKQTLEKFADEDED